MKEHVVITIGRQFGSGGRSIGRKLAQRIGVAFYDKELIGVAAKESGFAADIFEKSDEKISQTRDFIPWLNGYFFGSFSTQNYMSNDMLFKMQSEAIKSLASKQSCILVGRCSDYILRDLPCHISIFLHAPIDYRINVICNRMNISENKAKELIVETDKQRSGYYNYYSSRIWGDVKNYDLCINASILGEDGTVDLFADFVQRFSDSLTVYNQAGNAGKNNGENRV